MANLFDAANAQEGEPTQIVSGDFVQWKRSDIAEDYPASSGYSAEYVARAKGGDINEIKISQDAGTTDSFYLFSVSSAVSTAYEAGEYFWQLEVTQTSSGNRLVVDSGEFEILPDLDDSNADLRTHAEIMVDKIEGLLAGKADSDVASYSIAGRSLTKLSFEELMAARDHYRREVTQQKNAQLAKRGKKNSTTIQVRF